MKTELTKENRKLLVYKARRTFLGSNDKSGLVSKFLTYFVLTGLGFVFVYPIIYMISTSFMNSKDLVDSTITWIPRSFSVESFVKAGKTLEFWQGLRDSLIMTVLPAILQTFVLALARYGLGRFPVPLKKLWVALAVLIFLIPEQITMIPRYLMFNSYNLVGTICPTYLISVLGQGIKSSVFLLVYFQFFSSYPKSLDEAAQIDGAGCIKVFYKIALPMAVPAIVVCFLFSFIWIWNNTTR